MNVDDKSDVSLFVAELDTTQSLVAQPFHEGPERRHRQIVVVDDQPRRQARQVGEAKGRVHGNETVREAAGSCEEKGRHHQERYERPSGHHA